MERRGGGEERGVERSGGERREGEGKGGEEEWMDRGKEGAGEEQR